MVRMQGLTDDFTKANPDIKLNWVTLEENVLRQKVTTDIATKGGQFDVLTIGTYEVPIWAKKRLARCRSTSSAPTTTSTTCCRAIRAGLSLDGKLYAAPFYGESSFVMYRTDLMEKAGLKMPEKPTWDFIKQAADKMTDKAAGVYGICLRGKAGLGREHGVPDRHVQLLRRALVRREMGAAVQLRPEWKKTLDFYVALMKADGPPGASSNGFNENLALFNDGKCGMWIDATVAAGFVTDPKQSKVADKVGFALAPERWARQERQLAVGMVARGSGGHAEGRRRREVHLLGDLEALHRTRRREGRLGARSAGNPHLALQEPGLY